MSDQKAIAPAPPGSSHVVPPQLKQVSGRVSSACRMCRIRKSKCDGGQPCSKCITRKSQCIYENYDRRRERAALQHDFNRLTQTLRSHEELIHSLRTGDKQEVDDLVNLLRERETVGDVVKQFQQRGNRVKPRPSFSDSQTGTEASEGGSGSQGEATSRAGDVEMFVDSGTGESETNEANPLSAASTETPTDWHGKFDPLGQAGSSAEACDGRHDSISSTLMQMFLETGLASAISPHPPSSDCSQTVATFTVWPSPWTTVTDESDSFTLSHLMALCGTWTRPMYRFISLDLFYRDLCRQSLDSRFCSPSLVNAAAAMSCLICNHPSALADPLEHDSRGEHFAAEAKRHLNSRHKRSDLPSAQSLACLSIVEASRRRNTASWWYSALFFNMCLELGLPDHHVAVDMSGEGEDESEIEKRQLGLAAASFAIFFMERIWFNFLKASAPSSMIDLPLTTLSALQKSGNDHLVAASQQDCHKYSAGADYGGASREEGKGIAVPQPSTSHGSYSPADLDLNQLIKDMLQFMSTQWNYQSSRDLVSLHDKLKTWLFL